jgi:hypothetical protein
VDWSNEQYVRLYTRDTTNWKRLGWDGQCVLMALLRKVDRSGAVDLEGLDPWEAVMLHVGCPEPVARAGTAALLRVKTLKVVGDVLVFPNHMAAQEAVKSDKQRQKESREKRAAGLVTKRDATASQNVTDGHEAEQIVTPENVRSRPVTDGHSVLCSASPGSALPANANQPSAPARDGSADTSESAEMPTGSGHQQTVLDAFREAWPAGVTMPRLYGQKLREGVEHCRSVAKTHGKDLYATAKAVCLAAVPGAKDWDFQVAKVDPYAAQPPKNRRRGGDPEDFTGPAPATAFPNQERSMEEIFGPKKATKVSNG